MQPYIKYILHEYKHRIHNSVIENREGCFAQDVMNTLKAFNQKRENSISERIP